MSEEEEKWKSALYEDTKRYEGVFMNVHGVCVKKKDNYELIPTFGIGHRVRKGDSVANTTKTQEINCTIVLEYFKQDMEVAISDAKSIFNNFENHPPDVKIILADMSFQLGKTKLQEFKSFIQAINDMDYEEAAYYMQYQRKNSNVTTPWFDQSEDRSKEHVEKMKNISEKIACEEKGVSLPLREQKNKKNKEEIVACEEKLVSLRLREPKTKKIREEIVACEENMVSLCSREQKNKKIKEEIGCNSSPCPRAGSGSSTTWEKNAKEQIQIDEGTRRCVYKDHLGHLTAGIGHLFLCSDKDLCNLRPNIDSISCDVILRYYQSDFATAVSDAKYVANKRGNFGNLPDTVKEILVNMAFQLGRGGLSVFKKMLSAIAEEDYNKTANEMVDSKWYNQSGHRSIRLVSRMRAV